MKALKFLGIALLACGLMFTSCKKDNPQPSNNTSSSETPGGGTNPGGGDNPGGGGGQTVTEKITVSFDGNTWEPGFINRNYFLNYEGVNYCLYDLWIEEGNYLPSTDGTLALDANAEQSYQMNYYKETGYTLETTSGEEVQVGDWAWLGSNYNNPKTITGMAFDATTLVASFTVVAPMIDIYEKFANGNDVFKDMTIQYQNVTLVQYEETAKALNNSGKLGKVVSITRASK